MKGGSYICMKTIVYAKYIYSEYSFITNFFDFTFQAIRERSVFFTKYPIICK